jgi:LPS-assembly protein
VFFFSWYTLCSPLLNLGRAQNATPAGQIPATAAASPAAPTEPDKLAKFTASVDEVPTALTPEFNVRPPGPGVVRGWWDVDAPEQTSEGHIYHLRGHPAEIRGTDMIFRADEIDYDEDKAYIEARGNVFFQSYIHYEKITCDKVQYWVNEQRGYFTNPHGYVKNRVSTKPGVLTSDTPFYFQGKFAERVHDTYLLHHGYITGCKLPRPWWTLTGPSFNVVPDEHAIAHRALFRIKGIPIFYFPYFNKSLLREPRQSGFFTPVFGNSSRYGFMLHSGYYWAINRDYDMSYRIIDYTSRGYDHTIYLRGKPTDKITFDFTFHGVQDRGVLIGDTLQKQGGYNFQGNIRAYLWGGWEAHGSLDYLSSFLFRQSFTQSFNEAIFAETHSTFYLTKKFSSFDFTVAASRLQNFQDTTPGNYVIIRKTPEFNLDSSDHQLFKDVPLWFSLDSSFGLLARSQPAFETRQFVPRADAEPQLNSALTFLGIHVVPSFTLHEDYYGESMNPAGQVVSTDLFRNAREVNVDIAFPSIERIFNKKTFMGDKLKHEIETRARYRDISGVNDFSGAIRFDAIDLLSDDNEMQFSVINRLYAKRGDRVDEILTWEVSQARYFDPTFGGAIIPGQRNEVLATLELTPFEFIDRPRNYSPIVSELRLNPKNGISIEWRTDYDPLRHQIVNSSFSADFHFSKLHYSVGQNEVAGYDPNYAPDVANMIAFPKADQIRGAIGFGDGNRRGWNGAFTASYDVLQGQTQYMAGQATYNTDCCGFSFQWRRFTFGTLNDNQFRVAFTIANVGSFGTLKKQERLF